MSQLPKRRKADDGLIDPSRLVTMADISERLEVPRGTLDAWAYNRNRDYLEWPEPVLKSGNSFFYDWRDVQIWCQKNRPEVLLPLEERNQREVDKRRRQEFLKKANRLNKMHTPLSKVTNKDISEMAKGWREQDKGMTEYLSLELMRRGYRWDEDRTDWDNEAFQKVMGKVIAATREYGDHPTHVNPDR